MEEDEKGKHSRVITRCVGWQSGENISAAIRNTTFPHQCDLPKLRFFLFTTTATRERKSLKHSQGKCFALQIGEGDGVEEKVELAVLFHRACMLLHLNLTPLNPYQMLFNKFLFSLTGGKGVRVGASFHPPIVMDFQGISWSYLWRFCFLRVCLH